MMVTAIIHAYPDIFLFNYYLSHAVRQETQTQLGFF